MKFKIPMIHLQKNCNNIQYGYTQSSSEEKIGPKFLRITDIQNKPIMWETVPYCEITEKYFIKYKLEPGDIVIARTGASTGTNAIYCDNMPEAVFASYLVRIKTNSELLPEYVYYYLQSNSYKQHIESVIGGSAQPNANAKQLTDVMLPFHKKAVQNKIAYILISLDSKIEVNSSINSYLEKLGEAIFKRWFVDFEFPDENGEPFRSSGGVMKEVPQGTIPKDWYIKKLEYFGTISGGSTPSTKKEEYWGGDIPWITPKDLSNFSSGQVFIDKGERNITNIALKECSLKIFPKYSVIFSSRAPIGYIAIAENGLTCNQGFKNIIPKHDYYPEFLFYLLKNSVDQIQSISGGSTFSEVSGSVLKQFKVIVPSEKTIELFHYLVSPIFEYLKYSNKENHRLAELRDILIPRLMSGEIQVPVEGD